MKRLIYFLVLIFSIGNAKETESISGPSTDYEVLGVGAAIGDYFIFVSDEKLKEMGLEKGGWQPVNEAEWNRLYDAAKSNSSMMLGGSAMNVIKGIAHLGGKCAILGKVGSDSNGETFVKNLNELGIRSLLQKGNLPTGKALCFVTPDGQKTMRAYLGASHALGDLKMDPSHFANCKIFHVEGYQMVDNNLLSTAFALAKKAGAKISMDLGNTTLIRKHRKEIESYLKEYVNVVFANQEEAKELTGYEPMHACTYLASICEIAVVTMGENGGWVKRGKEHYYFPAIPATVKDTTGAGDLFASGFLSGLLKNRPLKECAWMGAYVASHIVRVVGADLPEEAWQELRERIKVQESMAKSDLIESDKVKRSQR